ncbi:hypothetical protein GQ53DRAFT_511311 [Thozetella sp. PMI_491]|nr:hypothetical protein GQ53DRAFT_511311 [Thozetella sp. PMI_491]
METLPEEIFSRICFFLPGEDLKNLRCGSRDCARVGARKLFKVVKGYPLPGGLDTMRNLSARPDLACHVRTLHYAGFTLTSCHFLEDFFTERYRGHHHPAVIDTHSREYGKIICEHQEMLAARQDVEALCAFFSACRHLRCLHFTCEHGYYDVFRPQSHFPRLYSAEPISGAFPQRLQGLHFLNLLRCLEASNAALEQIYIDWLDWLFFTRPLDFDTLFEPLKSVRQLEMTIRNDSSIHDGDRDGIHFDNHPDTGDNLGRCLAGLKELRELMVLSWAWVGYSSTSETNPWALRSVESIELTRAILPNVTYAHLQSLGLGGIKCERQHLVGLLARHKSTLRSLQLHEIYFDTTSWMGFLPQLRELLYLTNVEIYGVLEGATEDSVVGNRMRQWWEFPWEDPDDLHPRGIARYLIEGGIHFPADAPCPINLETCEEKLDQRV